MIIIEFKGATLGRFIYLKLLFNIGEEDKNITMITIEMFVG